MPTTITYGPVTLHNVLTRQWEQEVVHDDSGTDILYHKFKLRFESLVHAAGYQGGAPAWTAKSTGLGSAIGNFAEVRSWLSRDRQSFQIKMTNESGVDTTVLEAYPTASYPAHVHRDVNNGPHVTDLQVIHVAGGRCFRLSWAVEVSLVECVLSNQLTAVPWILNNRWSVREEMDESQFLSRTVEGTLRLSAPVAQLGNDFRGLVVPGLERGFRRAAIEFATDKTGLECTYRVLDRQVHTAAPWPAVKMDITHTEGVAEETKFYSDVTVRLEGSPDASRGLLITRAIQILEARLRFQITQAGGVKSWILSQMVITETIGDRNVVEARAQLQRTPENFGAYFASLREDVLGKRLELPALEGVGYDVTRSYQPAVYGYNPHSDERRPAVLWLLQCYLQDPCVNTHGITRGTLGTEGAADPDLNTDNTAIYESTEYTLRADPGNRFSEDAQQRVYTVARMRSDYHADDCIVSLPIAAIGGAEGEEGEASDATNIVIPLARGQCRRVIEFDCECAGQWPEIPQPLESYSDGAIRARRLRATQNPHPPTLAADGTTPIYRVSGRYEYQLSRPPATGESLLVGVLPITRFTPDETRFQPLEFELRASP